MTFGFSHEPLVKLAKSGISFFYRKIEVYGSENVPEEGPIIL
jgi:1-acyl-sn-glycerol-3-phosphate acyltransferase